MSHLVQLSAGTGTGGSRDAGHAARSRRHADRLEQWITLGAFLGVVVAWLVGARFAAPELGPFVEAAYPEGVAVESLGGEVYRVDGAAGVLGYVSVGEAEGYGGPLRVAVAVSPRGELETLAVLDHRETPSFLRSVLDAGLFRRLVGRRTEDGFRVGEDVDGVTGATYTTAGLAAAVVAGSRTVAVDELGLDMEAPADPVVRLGAPELILVLLLVVAFLAPRQKWIPVKQLRWATLLVGLVVLGVLFNRPLTLGFVTRLVGGSWPHWQTHLYWYLLLGAVVLSLLVEGKNPYCPWFCPFGATQDVIGVVGGARPRRIGHRELFQWLKRGLAWLAIVLGLLLRNPSATSYEVFGTFFERVGSSLQFGLLALVLVTALFVRRPWCTYLCPLDAVADLARSGRRWSKAAWRRS